MFVGCVTLVAGGALAAAPSQAARALGLEGQDASVRAIGFADLVLVPGLLRGNPRWPWMVARAALNVATAGYLHGVAPQARSPQVLNGAAAALAGLTAVDGGAGLALRRAGR